MDMGYEFSWSAFVFGALIAVAGVLLLRFYQQIADNLGSGAISYDRYKLAGLITTIVGIVVMLNLHALILGWILGFFF